MADFAQPQGAVPDGLGSMRSASEEPIGRWWLTGVVAGSILLAILMTWPLALHVGDATPSEWGDAKQTTYIFAWDAHVLAHHPTDLFQTPIFHPERDALAFTDHLLGVAIFAAPITWITGNIYLGHNVVFILALAFGAIASFLGAFELARNRFAAAVGGVAFAAAPYWFGPVINSSHVQIIAAGWIPMSVFAAIRWWRTGRRSALALLTVSVIFATLTSWYQSAFLVVTLVVTFVGLSVGGSRVPIRRLVAGGLVAAMVAASVIAPFAVAYRRVQARYPDYTRRLDQVEQNSASASSFLAAPETNVLWGDVTRRWRDRSSVEAHLFPGIFVAGLAALGLASARKDAGERGMRTALLALILAGVALSLGAAPTGAKRFFPWAYLHEHIPLFRALRAAARMHVVTITGMALAAALGARAVVERVRVRPSLMTIGIGSLIVLEGLAIPLRLGDAPRPAPIYRWLAERPGAILELPTGFRRGDVWDPKIRRDLDYMLFSVAHWRPLANGGSGYFPQSYIRLLKALPSFPDERTIAMLRERSIRTLVVHADDLDGTPWVGLVEKLRTARGIRLLERAGTVYVYDVALT